MSPRRYVMTRRAELVAKTRGRIIAAALELYRERGIAVTSIQEVARRADVSPATVLNQFGTADRLAKTVVTQITGDLHIPDDRAWTDVRSRAARIRRLVAELFAFYERSTPWFELFRGQMDSVPALRSGQNRFWKDIGAVFERIFGAALRHDHTRAAIFGLTNPATLGALRSAGMSVDDAAELIGDVLVRLVEKRIGGTG